MKISASKLIQYTDCGLKYKFHYKDKLDRFAASIHLVYGSAIHKALEELNKTLLGDKLHVLDVFDFFDKEWHSEIEKHNIRTSFYTDKLYNMGLNTLDKFYNENLDYEPIGSEIKFEVPIVYPDGEEEKEHTLHGLIDVIFKRKGKLYIVDYKTSKEKYPLFNLNTSIQLCLYSYAFRQLLKEKKFPNISHLQSKILKEEHYGRFYYILKNFIKGVDNELFLPNYSSNCKWCEFKQDCLKFKG